MEKTGMEYKLIEKIATISRKGTWSLELNIIKWGEHEAKYDLRHWNADHTKAGKGLTLTAEEIANLISAVMNRSAE